MNTGYVSVNQLGSVSISVLGSFGELLTALIAVDNLVPLVFCVLIENISFPITFHIRDNRNFFQTAHSRLRPNVPFVNAHTLETKLTYTYQESQ